jgi:hypothetical protein
MEEDGHTCPDRSAETDEREPPPGDFTSQELREDTARFLDELRRRAENKRRREPHKKSGPPPRSP